MNSIPFRGDRKPIIGVANKIWKTLLQWGSVRSFIKRYACTAVGRHWEAQWFRLRPELEAWDQGDSLLSLWLGTTEAQWFRLRPELEAWDRGDSLLSLWLGTI
jgi:hypothetical protein